MFKTLNYSCNALNIIQKPYLPLRKFYKDLRPQQLRSLNHYQYTSNRLEEIREERWQKNMLSKNFFFTSKYKTTLSKDFIHF